MYGPEEMSSLAARFLDEARRIVQKVVVAAGMSYSPNLLPTPLAEAVAHGTGVEGLVQQVPESVSAQPPPLPLHAHVSTPAWPI